ncbi:MAG: hypothetical protein HYS13_02645 [Planctomycetia bacterium]|nr:hypothetical protein [Planctomycetia bacterium]
MLSKIQAFLGQRGVHPREAAVGVALGVLAGFVSGWNLTLCCVLTCVLLLRAPIKTFLLTWGVSAVSAWLLTPHTLRAGRWLLDETLVGSWLAPHADSVWLALFDLDRYTLAGGLVVALPAAIMVAWLAAMLAGALAHYVRTAQDGSAKEASVSQAFVRAGCFALLGSARDASDLAEKPRLWRPVGIVAFLVGVVPAAIAGYLHTPEFVAGRLLRTLSQANCAEVEAGHVELSLSSGLLYVQNLAVADPDDLDRDRVRVAQVTAVVRPGSLLRGELHVEKALLEGIEEDVPRARRARPSTMHIPGFEDHADADGQETADAPDHRRAADCVQHWDEVEKRLAQAQAFIAKVEQLAAGAQDESAGSVSSYAAMRQLRCTFGRSCPKVQIDAIRAKGFAKESNLGRGAVLEIANLSSDPRRLGKPAKAELMAPERGLRVAAELPLHRSGNPHKVSFELRDAELSQTAAPGAIALGVSCEAGKITVLGAGTADVRKIDLRLTAKVSGLRLKSVAGVAVAGIPTSMWNEGLAQLQAFNADAELCGAWGDVRLRLDEKDFLAGIQRQLQAVADQHAAARTQASDTAASGFAEVFPSHNAEQSTAGADPQQGADAAAPSNSGGASNSTGHDVAAGTETATPGSAWDHAAGGRPSAESWADKYPGAAPVTNENRGAAPPVTAQPSGSDANTGSGRYYAEEPGHASQGQGQGQGQESPMKNATANNAPAEDESTSADAPWQTNTPRTIDAPPAGAPAPGEPAQVGDSNDAAAHPSAGGAFRPRPQRTPPAVDDEEYVVGGGYEQLFRAQREVGRSPAEEARTEEPPIQQVPAEQLPVVVRREPPVSADDSPQFAPQARSRLYSEEAYAPPAAQHGRRGGYETADGAEFAPPEVPAIRSRFVPTHDEVEQFSDADARDWSSAVATGDEEHESVEEPEEEPGMLTRAGQAVTGTIGSLWPFRRSVEPPPVQPARTARRQPPAASRPMPPSSSRTMSPGRSRSMPPPEDEPPEEKTLLGRLQFWR